MYSNDFKIIYNTNSFQYLTKYKWNDIDIKYLSEHLALYLSIKLAAHETCHAVNTFLDDCECSFICSAGQKLQLENMSSAEWMIPDKKKKQKKTISRMERKVVLLLTAEVLGDTDLSMEWERKCNFSLC